MSAAKHPSLPGVQLVFATGQIQVVRARKDLIAILRLAHTRTSLATKMPSSPPEAAECCGRKRKSPCAVSASSAAKGPRTQPAESSM